ncbi:sugar phosphate isomerase/epimerase family protein [Cecembia lonarensis]|uniref:Xylose isomerase-like TIM barrel n=1 Tax=Cecembia lonarensis (strain CCUG 58316 / KCTC 22772 / LW9) TaxID=1225176 RepID=K1L3N5_CECL9|nr:TIM barrel protein [Cecembia lonarensis]EKB49436.1 Xylose isomerase-like TIM barrel [Cecembia lonarensis LW9]
MKSITRILSVGLMILLSGSLMAQEIALQLYSLRNEMREDMKGSHQLVADWGIKYLEGGGTYGMELEEYKAFISGLGLSVIGVGADFKLLQENPQAIIDNAKAYGAKYATCFWIPHENGNFSIKETQEAIKVFNEAGKILKDAGITLCYHPHGYEFKPHGKGVLFDELLKHSKNYAFNMDVYWVQMGGGDPLAIMKKYPKKFPLLHLKDRAHGTPGSSDGRGDVETNVVLGTGDVDIRGLIKQAMKVGTEYLIIEDESSRSVQQIPQSVAFIKQVMAEK